MRTTDRYSILFEPVKIGPVTARNRFYQVPHCSGLGHLRPQGDAAMRAMKAEGGWGVVSTQEAEIHPSSDLAPYSEHRIWDQHDVPALRLMTDAVHGKGALAAIQLVHNGSHAPNLQSRAPVLAPSDRTISSLYPKQARAMDKSDIRALREWHKAAAIRSRDAGFDVVYVYAGHDMAIPQHFLLPRHNERTDEYGGSLENRVRLMRELLEDTKEAIGDTCAIALRFAVDEMRGGDGMQADEEGRAVVEMLADLPDIWDVNVSDWANDSVTTRFQPEDGYQSSYTRFVKQVTNKPVVSVGRHTSPDQMVSMLRSGIVDFIGAARPSIADPFLPNKIKEDRIEEIRECIGCNICVSCDTLGVPIRCTQNPTMGEEWRRGWHPEQIARKGSEEAALVVGAGPSGLECAMQLARRGYHVTLAEARDVPGGRVLSESGLPGLSAWRRVADNRLYDLQQRANVDMYLSSALDADAVRELGIPNVFVATGARWRIDGVGRTERVPVMHDGSVLVLTPDDIMAGRGPNKGSVLIYDDDQAYMGGVIAEKLAQDGMDVVYATPGRVVSAWLDYTLEQARVQTSLIEKGVRIQTGVQLSSLTEGQTVLRDVYAGRPTEESCSSVVLVTERHREHALYDALKGSATLSHLELIGDAAAPGLIADAVYSGHMAARNFEADPQRIEAEAFRREMPTVFGSDQGCLSR